MKNHFLIINIGDIGQMYKSIHISKITSKYDDCINYEKLIAVIETFLIGKVYFASTEYLDYLTINFCEPQDNVTKEMKLEIVKCINDMKIKKRC